MDNIKKAKFITIITPKILYIFIINNPSNIDINNTKNKMFLMAFNFPMLYNNWLPIIEE